MRRRTSRGPVNTVLTAAGTLAATRGRNRRRAYALTVAVATAVVTLTVATAVQLAPSGQAAAAATMACTAPAWAEGTSYKVGDQVTYMGHEYQAIQANTPPVAPGGPPPRHHRCGRT